MEGYIKGYMEAFWAPVVSRLTDAGGGKKPSAVIVLRRGMSRRLGAFYTALENACNAQRCWKVPNPVLRGTLRNDCVSDHRAGVSPVLGGPPPEVEVAAGRSVEELEEQLSNLFEG
ncbi:unnamed protein product [Urochloa humidicola]